MRIVMIAMLITGLSAGASWSQSAPSEPRSFFMEDLTSQELGAAIASGYTRVLVYSGCVEASGPHLALGKHNFRVRSYAESVARGVGLTLVVPIIPVAPTGDQLMRFPGTIDVRPEVFAELNAEAARRRSTRTACPATRGLPLPSWDGFSARSG